MVDGFDLRDLGGFERDVQIAKTPRLHQHTGFQRRRGLVVGIARLPEALADARPVFGEGDDALVQLLAQIADGLRILGQPFLAPPVGDGFEQGDEGRGGRENHALLHAVLDQCRIGLERCAVKRLARHEQDDEFGTCAVLARQMLPVGFFGQLAYMIA